jgi:hypothetical protein
VARRIAYGFLALALLGLTGLAGPALAPDAAAEPSTLVPAPPKGRGERCVADTAYMRRYHMVELGHQRDETVHEGIRTKRFSLRECIACHAVDGPDAKPVTFESPKHFCRVCHDYAAVSIDCFQCHASRPQEEQRSALPGDDRDVKALANYLKGGRP